MIKIQSFSDIITNSSSEVFICRNINGDKKVNEKLYEKLIATLCDTHHYGYEKTSKY